MGDIRNFLSISDILYLRREYARKTGIRFLSVLAETGVFEGNLNDGGSQLPIHGLSLLSSGVYIVNIKAGGTISQRKLVIK